MACVFDRCGENIDVTTVTQFQATAQFVGRHREVPHGDIGLRDSSETLFQFALVHRGDPFDDEPTAREVWHLFARHKQVAVLMKRCHPKAFCQEIETTSLHD